MSFLRQVSPASLLDVSAGIWQRGLVDESETIITQTGEMVAVLESPCAPTPQGQSIKDIL
jgi:hypothetical protein